MRSVTERLRQESGGSAAFDALLATEDLDELAEDRDAVLRQARSKLLSFDSTRLQRAVDSFGSVATRKRLREWAGG